MGVEGRLRFRQCRHRWEATCGVGCAVLEVDEEGDVSEVGLSTMWVGLGTGGGAEGVFAGRAASQG